MKSVFVIDDNEGILNEMRLLLEASGFLAQTFQNPAEFLDIALPATPFLILLDMRMPDTSGLYVQSALRERGLSAPIVFMSGESEPHEIILAMRDRRADFLLKPFSKDDLLVTVNRAFSRDAEERVYDLQTSERQQVAVFVKSSIGKLSIREQEIFNFIALGHSNREIALLLDMKTDTIKKHRASVYRKFEVSTFAELLQLLSKTR
jgi:FixJ family two-component response regulator